MKPYLKYYKSGNLWIEQYMNNCDEFHKENSPAIIEYWPNGNIKNKKYHINGVKHRENGPAEISYFENAIVDSERYCINGKYNRENGPAIIQYYENGNIYLETYMIDNKIHRFYGPSSLIYRKNGKVKETFYLNGKSYTKKVEKWIKENDFNSWQEMTVDDFDRMWLDILKN